MVVLIYCKINEIISIILYAVIECKEYMCNELSIINVAKTYVKEKILFQSLKVNNYYDMRNSL